MTIKIGTWNLQNFGRPGDQAGARNDAEYEDKLATLAEVIDALAPPTSLLSKRSVRRRH